ncbi:MAG: ABC transporter permease [Chitinivibrionales bacterium]|nr:ABC transporter permease [Chitinivibrionales bacterium]
MDFIEAVKNSYQMLVRNKMRSFLTMLGIIIGVMSVIVVMSLGESAQGLILNEIKSMGSNLIGVLPGGTIENGPPASAFGVVITTLKNKDGEDILRGNNPHVEGVAMTVRGNDIIYWNGNKLSATFLGTSASYMIVQDAVMDEGRFFTDDEDLSNAKVAVIGSDAAKELFGDQDPLGNKIKIKESNFTIIGVFKKKGGGLMQSQDKEVFVPLKTAQNLLLGINYINSMAIKVDGPDNVSAVQDYVTQVLRENHNITDPKDDDFTVRATTSAIEAISQITDAVKFFLVAISAISLVVGGFGIMNIMLATVQERTKEIGLRKAVGAKSSQITLQFLIEAVFITFVSGIFGIILGTPIAAAVASVAGAMGYAWDLIISPSSVFWGCFVSVSVGLIFGIIPARKASLLDPIEALRYE